MSGELDALASALDLLELPVDTQVLAEGFALLDRLSAKLTGVAGNIDAADLYDTEGAVSMTGWLKTFAGMTGSAAASTVKTARRLRSLPVTAAAWESGALSTGQVQVILANIPERCMTRFADHEAVLVRSLAPLTIVDTITAMQEWRRKAEALLDDEEHPEPPSSVHVSRTLDGRVETSGSFDADDGAVIEAALNAAITEDAEDEERTAAQRRADAEVAIHQFFLDHQRGRTTNRRRPHVDLVVRVDDDGNVSGNLLRGAPLPRSTVERVLCDCTAHRVLVDAASAILDYGRDERTAPEDLRRQVILRDQHCRGHGCDCPPEWCDLHHVFPWERGGPTSLDNLVLKCRRHHKQGHRPGWHDQLLPDGTYVVTDPSGRSFTTHPPGTLLAAAA